MGLEILGLALPRIEESDEIFASSSSKSPTKNSCRIGCNRTDTQSSAAEPPFGIQYTIM